MKNVGRVVAMVAVAAAAGAGTIFPPGNNVCGAGAIDTNPSSIEGESEFDAIYDNLIVKVGDEEVDLLYYWDEYPWPSDLLKPGNDDKNYMYMMVRLDKPGGYTTGTLAWKIWQVYEGQGPVFQCYRWNTASSPHAWDYLNANDGLYDSRPVGGEIPASYFDANGDLWLLFVAYSGAAADWLYNDITVIGY